MSNMAFPTPAPPPQGIDRREMEDLVRRVRGTQLYNRQLSSICQVNGLKSTGVKADLQRRITDLVTELYSENDVLRYQQVRHSILNAIPKRQSPQGAGQTLGTSPAATQPGMKASPYANSPGMNGHAQAAANGYARHTGGSAGLMFHASPFYNIETAVTSIYTCPIMTQHRNSIHLTIRLSDSPALQKCVDNSTYRVMLFCAGEVAGVQHIAFPHQSELKVNGGDFKANLRGLKNKPGSTRPVDITNALRLRSSYTNNIEFTYALTTKKFYLVLYVCKIKSVADLVASISVGQRIPKASVVAELNKKAMDPDIVATSQVLSLRCPLTYMRLDVPCRGTHCTHIQCFDSTSYLQLQEQGPQWSCPICSKSVPYEQLAVDEYVRDILNNTSKDVESVTIEPDGRWHLKSEDDHRQRSSQASGAAASFGNGGIKTDGDDDELEISEVSFVGGSSSSRPSKVSASTPTQQRASVSTSNSFQTPTPSAPRGAGSTSTKRPAPEVVDLTLSSDEDEPAERPAKRQNRANNGTGLYGGNMDFLGDATFGYPPQ